MSTRSLDGGWSREIQQIERKADTKGIDIDDIEVNETRTDDGDQLVTFRIYETKAETEEESVGIQVSKMPQTQLADMSFENEVQKKLSSLKKYIVGDDSADDLPDPDEVDSDSDGGEDVDVSVESDTDGGSEPNPSTDADEPSEHVSSTTINVDSEASGPGARIDARLARIEAQQEELDERLTEIEQYIDVLEAMQGTFGSDSTTGDDE